MPTHSGVDLDPAAFDTTNGQQPRAMAVEEGDADTDNGTVAADKAGPRGGFEFAPEPLLLIAPPAVLAFMREYCSQVERKRGIEWK